MIGSRTRRLRAFPRWSIDRWDASPDGVGAFWCGWELRPRTSLYLLLMPWAHQIDAVAVAGVHDGSAGGTP